MEAFPKKVVNFNIPIHSQVLALSIDQDKGMELDVQKSLSKFTISKNLFPKPLDGAKIVLQYSEWVRDQEVPLIFDFHMIFSSVPPWVSAYSTTKADCIHHMMATMKVRGSQPQYKKFISDLRKTLMAMQCHSLEKVFFNL